MTFDRTQSFRNTIWWTKNQTKRFHEETIFDPLALLQVVKNFRENLKKKDLESYKLLAVYIVSHGNNEGFDYMVHDTTNGKL